MEITRANTPLLFALLLALVSGGFSLTFTFKNNCGYKVWPGTLTIHNKPQLSSTGFELASGASHSLDASAGWSGRLWARTHCSSTTGTFKCDTADCASGQISCNGAEPIQPVTLVEFETGSSDQKFYDIRLANGFNLPVSVTPKGGTGECKSVACSANVNSVCPSKLSVKGSAGSTIACKSACDAFKNAEYCCTGAYSSPDTCKPTKYSKIFKDQCPQAYSYAYDESTSPFTCTGANYLITFCP
ncbi:hypothetical protein NE237_020467 [Protea cynaroides]|uniref:Thaumatin-like protein n=1 Tax=Protea cynaroides TaxID=273540 RepID=A0A9Q0K2L8_9MAGN|nr:hypothetical protein NE237_020467 [Protea cynaroides]